MYARKDQAEDTGNSLDFLPRNPAAVAHKPLLHWLIRRVEVRIHHWTA
jgi:hypothetical protein